jgi:hypothetical protein
MAALLNVFDMRLDPGETHLLPSLNSVMSRLWSVVEAVRIIRHREPGRFPIADDE